MAVGLRHTTSEPALLANCKKNMVSRLHISLQNYKKKRTYARKKLIFLASFEINLYLCNVIINKTQMLMKKMSLFLLSLLLCSVSVPALAEDISLVPATVVQMNDGSRQIVQLSYTSVTDLTVLCSKGALSVSVPEADVKGVRSIRFAMLRKNSLEEVSSWDNATIDKVLLNDKIFIRVTLPDGKQVWYDVLGNLLK